MGGRLELTGLHGCCPSQRVLDARLIFGYSLFSNANKWTHQARQAAFTGCFTSRGISKGEWAWMAEEDGVRALKSR